MGSTGAINIPVDDLWHCILSSDQVAWSSDTYTCAKASELANHYKVSYILSFIPIPFSFITNSKIIF